MGLKMKKFAFAVGQYTVFPSSITAKLVRGATERKFGTVGAFSILFQAVREGTEEFGSYLINFKLGKVVTGRGMKVEGKWLVGPDEMTQREAIAVEQETLHLVKFDSEFGKVLSKAFEEDIQFV